MNYRKNIAIDNDAQPSYTEITRTLRSLLAAKLSRNNGIINIEEIFRMTFFDKKELQHLKGRLFCGGDNERLVWNKKIQSPEAIANRLKIPLSEVHPDLLQLFCNSRDDINRTNYHHLASADKKHLHIEDRFDPIYGFSVLVRPINSFSKTADKNYSYTIGRNTITLFVHTGFDNKDCYYRLAFGNNVVASRDNKFIEAIVANREESLLSLFRKGEYQEFISLIVPSLNQAIDDNILRGN